VRFATLAASAAAALALVPAVPAAQPPPARLTLTSRTPVVVRGDAFRAYEAVRLTVVAKTTSAFRVRANGRGIFTVTARGVTLSRCGAFYVRAVGAGGSVAALKLPLPACMPAQNP
jgi:hypothetical protein